MEWLSDYTRRKKASCPTRNCLVPGSSRWGEAETGGLLQSWGWDCGFGLENGKRERWRYIVSLSALLAGMNCRLPGSGCSSWWQWQSNEQGGGNYYNARWYKIKIKNTWFTPAREADNLTTAIYCSLGSSKSSPLISSPILQQDTCCVPHPLF